MTRNENNARRKLNKVLRLMDDVRHELSEAKELLRDSGQEDYVIGAIMIAQDKAVDIESETRSAARNIGVRQTDIQDDDDPVAPAKDSDPLWKSYQNDLRRAGFNV